MKTDNPVLRPDRFEDMIGQRSISRGDTMTISGTINKTGILVLLAFATASFTWQQFFSTGVVPVGWMAVGAIGGLVAALATTFKPDWAPVTAPTYALLEGLFLGGISAMFAHQYNGIVFQAVGLTFGTLMALLAAYRAGIIRATEGFKAGIIAATGGIALFYLISIVLGMFGIQIPLIHEGGIVGIGFSLVVTAVAALNLVLDFDFIESYEGRAPASMEWVGAFGIMVTLVWLYIEFLKLLAKLNRRD